MHFPNLFLVINFVMMFLYLEDLTHDMVEFISFLLNFLILFYVLKILTQLIKHS